MRKEKISGVYAVHLVTQEGINYVYVGSSNNLASRGSGHLSKLKRGCHHSKKMQELFNDGAEYKFEILIICDLDNLIDMEQEYINFFNKLDDVVVLNVKDAEKRAKYKQQLDVYKVKLIKMMIATGMRNKDIAEQLQIKQELVSRIKSGERWSHVTIN